MHSFILAAEETRKVEGKWRESGGKVGRPELKGWKAGGPMPR
jgi:hypothetical protein